MASETDKLPQDVSSLKMERDLFKKQFLKIRSNYQNKIKELSILKELGNTLRSTNFYDRNTLFKEQLEIIKKYCGVEQISLMLVNEELRSLEVIARTYVDGAVSNPIVLPMNEGHPGRSLTDKTPVVIDEVKKNPIFDESLGISGGSLLYLPVLHNNKGVGVLSLRHLSSGAFDQNQVRFLSLVADHLSTTIVLSRLYHQMLKEENRRSLLSRFFSKTVTEEILGSSGNIRLGGERKNVTILFADLSGFTAMSESLEQEKVVEILNAYFSFVTPIIFKHKGTLDKIMGDGLLALFGAPISRKDDTMSAVRTAVEILQELKLFNKAKRLTKWPSLQASIGISSGEVVAGYIGSDEHLNYTVIGDPVNVAQRIEAIAEHNTILISKTVYDEIKDRISEIHGLKQLVPLPAQKVKGKKKTIEVYKLIIRS